MRNKIVEKAALQLNLPHQTVWEVYSSYWKFVRQHLMSLPLKEDITKEEFDKLSTSINVPSLGKIYTDWEFIKAKKKRENERHKNK